ncbi:MAG: electron transport complex subunit RsxC [Clostridia bacterium]|nr:electron transport complex subunit RsxC [Clostridia bacterium]MBQ1376140.1 electron transport complex subunit RsxC [Clostridia bacterium]MBQ1435189.1 electron transport complex subunit RsxC [Clostridia bacterium]MBQ4249848.1 electron transport complex subunit RsxC [Clostridia bacterium]
MKRTFKGGAHPHDFKELSKDKAIVTIDAPDKVIIPLSQHIGAPCEPLVAVGDHVKMGQKIGDSKAFISSPVHSSVSGTVLEIKPCPNPRGVEVMSVIIENDHQDEPFEDFSFNDRLGELDRDTLISLIREGGIVGMGGAGFPTSSKIISCAETKIDYVIINAAECEPYLTNDYRLMMEYPNEIIDGLTAITKIFDSKIYFAVEDNKQDVIDRYQEMVKNRSDIEIVPLKTKYPQGGEKQLVYAVSGRVIPTGKLPSEVGAIIMNAGTVYAIYEMIQRRKPLFERIVTVTGDAVFSTANVRVRIGSTFDYVLEKCGGFKEEPAKVIMGGPMMGAAQYRTDIPVVKTTSGILCLTKKSVEKPERTFCIRCGKCINACPMNLLPVMLSMYAEKKDYEKLEKFDVMSCIECGTCSFTCPGKKYLVQNIRDAKAKVGEIRRRRAEEAKAKKEAEEKKAS